MPFKCSQAIKRFSKVKHEDIKAWDTAPDYVWMPENGGYTLRERVPGYRTTTLDMTTYMDTEPDHVPAKSSIASVD